MLKKVEEYANSHNINFSTNPEPIKSKTKGIIFGDKTSIEPVKLSLNGNELPWVNKAKYLGNTITNEINGLQKDIMEKRAAYIERNCEILQEFPFGHPEFKCHINKIYNSSFPGSNLWDYTSENFQFFINSWSVSVRHMWNLPRESHRFFIEPLGGTHAKVMIYSRFIKFIQNIQNKSKKMSANYLLQLIKNDTNSITGKNIRQIADDINNFNLLNTDIKELKNKLCFVEQTEENQWKINAIKEITNVKQNEMTIVFDNDKMTHQELDHLIQLISTE